MTLMEKLERIRGEKDKSYWADRISAELEYLFRLSAVKGGRFDRDIAVAADGLIGALSSDGVITDGAARFAEKLLLPLSEECKKLTVLCIGHAHIDMNWMWGFQETAGLTVDTFRTVLDLMDEYPEFTFAQSQASVYRIIEEYAPWMMDRMKLRIGQGRWEVTASTWVETDKNMPSGESLTRHILNTKEYMSRTWGLDPDSLTVDFEPDTFGHSLNVPEICAAGGVKYYYHCRGENAEGIYRWVGPSGAELLCYREVKWYNGFASSADLAMIPEFCSRYGVNAMLKLIGVGDHGGGPTRRDIERVRDMASWPLAPEIRWGTFKEYFSIIEENRENFPVLPGEKNFIFTGCYTSQSRIKMANRIGEARLYDGEFLAAGAEALADSDLSAGFDAAWEKILFNHFHDILPGSGKVDTREYALGQFQRALAAVNTASTQAMRDISDRIDVTLLPLDDDKLTVSEGAGVGYTLGQDRGFELPKTERGRGKNRAFAVFNSASSPRKGPVELTVWDWPGDRERLQVLSSEGKVCKSSIVEVGTWYWDHSFVRIEAEMDIPALGWAVYWVTEGEKKPGSFENAWFCANDRRDLYADDNIVLDNGILRAEFDRREARLVSLKKDGRELISSPACGIDYIEEDTVNGMTAWRVGYRSFVECLNEKYPVRVERVTSTHTKQSFTYSIEFRASKLEVTVSLGVGCSGLEFAIHADWHEIGGKRIPGIVFSVPYAYASEGAVCGVPMGTAFRRPAAHDIPCVGFCSPVASDGAEGLSLMAETKYGFRNSGNVLSVSLIRASVDPDPYPEYGVHDIRLGLEVTCGDENTLVAKSDLFCHRPAVCSTLPHEGVLAPVGSFFSVENAAVSAVKPAQNGCGTVVRIYNPAGSAANARVTPAFPFKKAYLCDSLERITGEAGAEGISLAPMGMATVLFEK
ncbi:MAG: alpha-mannosidase [Ruminococcaceae bacterium]|nr:alpha-mannosidase [Oscillospiraceae bacterium]